MEELDKVLKSWEYIVGHNDGKLSKAMAELILQTIKLLWELKRLYSVEQEGI